MPDTGAHHLRLAPQQGGLFATRAATSPKRVPKPGTAPASPVRPVSPSAASKQFLPASYVLGKHFFWYRPPAFPAGPGLPSCCFSVSWSTLSCSFLHYQLLSPLLKALLTFSRTAPHPALPCRYMRQARIPTPFQRACVQYVPLGSSSRTLARLNVMRKRRALPANIPQAKDQRPKTAFASTVAPVC